MDNYSMVEIIDLAHDVGYMIQIEEEGDLRLLDQRFAGKPFWRRVSVGELLFEFCLYSDAEIPLEVFKKAVKSEAFSKVINCALNKSDGVCRCHYRKWREEITSLENSSQA